MTKLAIAFTIAAAILVTGLQASSVAAASLGSNVLSTATKNFTPIHKAACGGWGRWCPPGSHRVCGPWRCWCAPC